MKDLLYAFLKVALVSGVSYGSVICIAWVTFSRANPVTDVPSVRKVELFEKIQTELLQTELKEEIEKQVTKTFAENPKTELSVTENSPLVQDYIKGQVALAAKQQAEEAKNQAETATKDAIEKAKGELFWQVSFPVIAAIVSIFAAFIVKDILTEVLKDKEKQDIERILESKIYESLKVKQKELNASFREYLKSGASHLTKKIDNDIDNKLRRLTRKVERIKWLEYEVSDLAIFYSAENYISTESQGATLSRNQISELSLTSSLKSIDILRQIINLGYREKSQAELLLNYEQRVFQKRLLESNLGAKDRTEFEYKLEKCLSNAALSDDSDFSEMDIYMNMKLTRLYNLLVETIANSHSISEKEEAQEALNKLNSIDSLASWLNNEQGFSISDEISESEDKNRFNDLI
jgi:hypothetical protein